MQKCAEGLMPWFINPELARRLEVEILNMPVCVNKSV